MLFEIAMSKTLIPSEFSGILFPKLASIGFVAFCFFFFWIATFSHFYLIDRTNVSSEHQAKDFILTFRRTDFNFGV
jgi:hypothetical protein